MPSAPPQRDWQATSTVISPVRAAIRTGLAMLLIAAVTLNCFNIATRYFLNFSFLAGDELQVFAMVAIAFLGAIVVSAERRHLSMDILIQAAPARARRALSLVEVFATAGFAGLMAWHSAAFLTRIVGTGQRSAMADLPMWLPHGTVTVGFAGIALLALLRLPAILTRSENDL